MITGLDSFSKPTFSIFGPIWIILVFVSTTQITVILMGH